MNNILLNWRPQDILVFESNSEGIHMLGMAKFANEYLEAQWGQGEGLSGQTYALPIKTFDNKANTKYDIENAIDRFKHFALEHPQLNFFLTRIGSETKDLDYKWIQKQFKNSPKNIILPESW